MRTATSDLGPGVIARRLPCNRVSAAAPFHWIALAFADLRSAPLLSLGFGLLFSLIPAAILMAVIAQGSPFVILAASVAFALVGPVFAVVLYDIAWQLERGRKPSFAHSFKSLTRNPQGTWGFAVILSLLMMAWMRLAALVYALYPTIGTPGLGEMAAFLAVGSALGALMLTAVFAISAFSPQIMLERRVDMMTAVVTSVAAVRENAGAMVVWAGLLSVFVLIGFATSAIGFIVIMPLLSYASWHGYIAVIKTRKARDYE